MSEENEGIVGLSDEHKENPSIKDFTDVNALAQAHIDTKAMVGKMIRIPGEDASTDDVKAFKAKLLAGDMGVIPTPDLNNPEEAAAYFLKMGAPEKDDGYTKIEGMPDARFAELSKMAHAAGISDKQFSQVAKAMVEGDNATNTAIVGERDTGIASLKTEWGEAYNQKFARAQRLVEATKAPTGLLTAIADGAIDAESLKWLDSLAEQFGGEGSNLIDLGNVTDDTKGELEHQRDELTRRLQSDERMPHNERQRLIAKNVDLNTRILAIAG